jgi:hypothetical protein
MHHLITRCTTSATPQQWYGPLFLDHALGLGLGYNLSRVRRKEENPIDFACLCKDIHKQYAFCDKPPGTLKLPKLYVKSPTWEPNEAHVSETDDVVSVCCGGVFSIIATTS